MSEDAQDVVLIVEDDESIMFVLGEYLAGLGYRVLKAIDGEQAFEILATKPHLDLMVTDYRLPGGISGVQIAEPAIKLRPELKVIFISGYPQESSTATARSRAMHRSWPSRLIWIRCKSISSGCWLERGGVLPLRRRCFQRVDGFSLLTFALSTLAGVKANCQPVFPLNPSMKFCKPLCLPWPRL